MHGTDVGWSRLNSKRWRVMHLWIAFLHASSVVVFLLAHGASHSMSLRIHSERNAAASVCAKWWGNYHI